LSIPAFRPSVKTAARWLNPAFVKTDVSRFFYYKKSRNEFSILFLRAHVDVVTQLPDFIHDRNLTKELAESRKQAGEHADEPFNFIPVNGGLWQANAFKVSAFHGDPPVGLPTQAI
jgi:hypothetical protein